MARPAWVIGAFAAGIAVGFGLARLAGNSNPEIIAPVAANPVSPPSRPPPLVTAATVPADSVPAPTMASRPRPSAATTTLPGPLPDSATVPDDEYSGYLQPVDVGPVFKKIMAQKPPPGAENHLGDLHRALERELRDDSWAYGMEAEIQNSLVAETSAGKLTVEHLECRATLCELRLSGSAVSEQALADWSGTVGKQPWSSRLYLNVSSSVSDDERVDSLLIFRRPSK